MNLPQPSTPQRSAHIRAATLIALAVCASSAHAQAYKEIDLVSDIPGRAAVTDPNLVNPWGISFGPGRPFWFSDAGTGLTTLNNADGSIVPLVVTIPAPASLPGTTSSPTGQVFSGGSGLALPGGTASNFAFATEQGTIATWTGGTTAVTAVDNSAQGSVYKGLEITRAASGTRLYAADFHNGRIDVFGSQFQAVNLGAGAFVDPNLPSGYAPFNIANFNGKLLVAYAQQDATAHDEVAGAGKGFVDLFNLDGSFSQRLISGGPLNAPWGVALAPASFGAHGGELLIGNFGDGTINAFDPVTGTFKGSLLDGSGNPIAIDGLWGLTFRPDLAGQDGKLFFTAGINDEANGLFGAITTVPEPSSFSLVAIAGLPLWWKLRRRQQRG